MIVTVENDPPNDRAWGATLINVQYIDGQWVAVVQDNYYYTIYTVPAVRLKQWQGEV